MKRVLAIALVCVGAGASSVSHADEKCKDNPTIEEHFCRLQSQALAAGIAKSKRIRGAGEESELDRQQGLTNAVSGAELGVLATSLVNLLPGASGIVWGGDPAEGSAPNAGLQINSRSLGLSGGALDAVVTPAIATDPDLLPPLRAALEEAGAVNTLEALEDALDGGDAPEVSVTLALLNQAFGFQFGRRASRYHDLYASLIAGVQARAESNYNASVDDENSQLTRSPAEALSRADLLGACGKADADFFAALGKTVAEFVINQTKDDPDKAGACALEVERALADAAAELGEAYRLAQIGYQEAQLDQFLDLVANNAQLLFTGRYGEIDSVVDASFYAGRITLELAIGPSIGRFLDRHEDECAQRGSGNPQACYDAYVKWLGKSTVRGKTGHDHRVSIFVEGARLDEIDLSISTEADQPLDDGGDGGLPGLPGGGGDPAPVIPESIEIFLPATTRIHAGLRWGYTFYRPPAESQGGFGVRLDAGADWFWFDSAVLRNERWRAFAGVTLQAFGLSFPLQVVYEDAPEFDAQDRIDDVRLLGGIRANFR